jgi:hypothetical protein
VAHSVTGNNIGLSFIDVLASALGAAVLLFVIFASTPPRTISRAKAVGTFIRYEWKVDEPKALLRIFIYPPNNAPAYPLDPEETAGRVVIGCKEGAEKAGANSILVAGFSPNSGLSDGSGGRTYVLRLNGTGPGDWRVGLKYFARTGDDPLRQAPEIHVTKFYLSPDGTTSPSGGNPTYPPLKYGDEIKSQLAHETGKRENACSKH